jgi:hypothetical protein
MLRKHFAEPWQDWANFQGTMHGLHCMLVVVQLYQVVHLSPGPLVKPLQAASTSTSNHRAQHQPLHPARHAPADQWP